MKICILTPRYPLPIKGGDSLRIINIAKHLKAQGHELILVSIYDKNCDQTEEAMKIFSQIHVVKRNPLVSAFFAFLYMLQGKPIQCGYYYSPKYLKAFKKIVEQTHPDLYISHLTRMCPYIEKLGLEQKTIVEMTDALSRMYGSSAKAKGGILKKAIYRIEKNLIARYEHHVVYRYPKIVLVSQEDIDYLERQEGHALPCLELHTNGVECKAETTSKYDNGKICFVGHMNTLQNEDAAIHFAKDIFPLIREKKPDARFYIIGGDPTLSVMALGKLDHITVTGFVDDLDNMLADTCLAVAPIRIAAGIQNKVLVAMSNAIPVILTPLIAKAIPELVSGENCLISEESHDFADQCVALMENEHGRNDIAIRGNEVVRRHYLWNRTLQGYESLPQSNV